jgi:hypothetical protein
MPHVYKVLGWLNANDRCTFLNNEVRWRIRVACRSNEDTSRVERILERLRSVAHSSDDPREKAEILLCCAAVSHRREWYPQAARDALEAVVSYENDDHRRAVALWILGMAQWEMLRHHDAHTNWVNAKNNFERCQALFPRPAERKDWYEDWLWQMKVELVAHPEEILTWLNCFERSSLRPSSWQVVKPAQEKIRCQTYPSIYILMQDLQEATQRSEGAFESAEIQLTFSVGAYQMGFSHFAIELLRKAVINFHPGMGTYHKQAIARCMLGAVEWTNKLSQNQAVADWRRCVDEFEDLRKWADRDNLNEKEAWYLEHHDVLQSALLERVRPPKQSAPDNSTPKESPSAPPPRSSTGTKRYTYQDLLFRVGGDQAAAERLINSERKTAPPTADRNELIHRAVEKWIRDNQ